MHIDLQVSKEDICDQFTEVLRDFIRAISAEDDTTGGISRAARGMGYLEELFSKLDENISWYELFTTAMKDLRPDIDWKDPGFNTLIAAQAGTSMLMEMTCSDNLARARTSKKRSKFLRAIEVMEDEKKERREKALSGAGIL